MTRMVIKMRKNSFQKNHKIVMLLNQLSMEGLTFFRVGDSKSKGDQQAPGCLNPLLSRLSRKLSISTALKLIPIIQTLTHINVNPGEWKNLLRWRLSG